MTIREIDELVDKIDKLVMGSEADSASLVDWRTRAWPIRRQLLRELVEDAVKE